MPRLGPVPQFPLGYCSEFCDSLAQDCSTGSLCYDGQHLSSHGVCLHTCTSDFDCRTADGYACLGLGLAQKVCMIAPEMACNDYRDNDGDGLTDCQDPTNCQSLPACTAGPTPVGQPCAQHSECAASAGVNNPFCFDQFHTGRPNGYCSHFCDPAAPTDCGTGRSCVPKGPGGANVCMVTCTLASQCRVAEGYSCRMGVCDL